MKREDYLLVVLGVLSGFNIVAGAVLLVYIFR